MRKKSKLRIVPLGGVSEIGKNMLTIEYKNRILVIDCGLKFPDDDMLGVDIVIPDVSYLIERADQVEGIILTHGHEDHIGALPYVLRQINAPVWGAKLTLGLLQAKLEEHKLTDVMLHELNIGDRFNVGVFDIETIRVSHSIPDVFGLAIRTSIGTLVHTGDFKFDQTPVDGKITDFSKFTRLGEEGVALLFSDCTNVEKPGYVQTEQIVGKVLEDVFAKTIGKVIIALFASNINRMQMVMDAARKYGRKVAIAGRSMLQNAEIAQRLGYLSIPDDTLIKLETINDYHSPEVAIMTTGGQGEPLAALARIATGDHKHIEIEKGDVVIISATPIPGNEDLVARVVNHLFKRGAKVIYDKIAPVHVSGHANREDLKLMLNLTKPKYVVPVHGEHRHVARFEELAVEMGMPQENIFRLEAGDVLELDGKVAEVVDTVPAGDVFVDGIGVGDVADVVLRDRRHLAYDGFLIVALGIDKSTGSIVSGPEIISRGFIYMEEAETLIEDVKRIVVDTVTDMTVDAASESSTIKADIRKSVAKLLYVRTHRRPMVIPVVTEI